MQIVLPPELEDLVQRRFDSGKYQAVVSQAGCIVLAIWEKPVSLWS
ncbi:MAG: hypothetical protein JOZ78_01430 [Chroococcidiopsidaceae cyanobacterium CP_BM_ER_R8_30]|nr:hypothetical protein [Chroococcidiopsidaceae cyanobacterium CP_BM_ER_R8_30]